MDVNELLNKFDLPPLKWTSKEVSKWLDYLNMGEYKEAFEKNKVDGLNILDIEDEEIEDYLGIKNSIHRKRVRNGINILKGMQKEFNMRNRPNRAKPCDDGTTTLLTKTEFDRDSKENIINDSVIKSSASLLLISDKKLYKQNRQTESRKGTTIHTVLKKSSEQQPLEDIPLSVVYGYNQNVYRGNSGSNGKDEDELGITSDHRKSLEMVFNKIEEEEGKVEDNKQQQQQYQFQSQQQYHYSNIQSSFYNSNRKQKQQHHINYSNTNNSRSSRKYHQDNDHQLDSSFDLLHLLDDHQANEANTEYTPVHNPQPQSQQQQDHTSQHYSHGHRYSQNHKDLSNSNTKPPHLGFSPVLAHGGSAGLSHAKDNMNLDQEGTQQQQKQQASPSLFSQSLPGPTGTINNPSTTANTVTTTTMSNQLCELIIQPIDNLQSNNFYCINENGGRIGRHSNNEIVIFEESVSRHHAMIEVKNQKFWIVDVGSTTGTFVKLISTIILEPGMILELGSNQFLVDKIDIESDEKGILTLKIIEGMQCGREIVIHNSASIGRKAHQNTISFNEDFHLSNIHAKINFNDGCFIIEDLGSTNGSWMRLSPQGIRSQPYELIDGLIFKIGAISTFKVKKTSISYCGLTNNEPIEMINTCAICYESEKDTVFLPCKHNVACIRCSKNVKLCPICRIKIKETLRIYKS